MHLHLRYRPTKLGAVLACLALAAAAATSIGVAAGVSGGKTTSPRATAGHAASLSEVVTAWPADATSLDPQNESTDQDHELTRNIYQGLISPAFRQLPDGTLSWYENKFVGVLADKWTIAKSSITFHIRPGVKFYPSGNPVTAEDARWSISRLWDTPGVGDIKANGLQSPSQLKVVNPSTFRVNYVNAQGKPMPVNSVMLAIFREHFFSIVDSVEAKKHATAGDKFAAKWLRNNAVGTGPYYIASRTPGTGLVLNAVPATWAPQPYYKTVTIRISSASTASLLQGGDINVGEFGFTNQQANSMAKDKNLTVLHGNTPEFMMFAIAADPGAGPMRDQTVRTAMAYALPYDRILKDVFFNRARRDLSIVDASAIEYTPAWASYKENIVKAKSLMAQAGNPKFTVPFLYQQGDADQQSSALYIQANLKQLGITAQLTPVPRAALFDALNARSTPPKGAAIGPPGVVLFNWSAWIADPKVVIGYWATKGGINNYSLWSDPRVDAANKKYELAPTSPARTAAYKQAQRIIAAGAANLPIINTGRNVIVARGLAGVNFRVQPGMGFWMLHPVGKTNPFNAKFVR